MLKINKNKKMCEYSIINSFLGLKEEYGNFFIESIDLNNNINQKILPEFLFEKDSNNILIRTLIILVFVLIVKRTQII